MIDTDGDGKVSKAAWLAYREKVFAALDRNKSGKVDQKAFMQPSNDMVSLATGGYARGLQTKVMMRKIDTNGDGTVSHDEFIAYQTRVFEMIDKTSIENVGPQDFIGK